MKIINRWGNVIRDVGNNKDKAEYFKSQGYKEYVEKKPAAKTPQKQSK